MTDQPGSFAPAPRPGGGRHSRPPSKGQRAALAAGVVIAIAAVVGVVTIVVRSGSSDTAAGSTGAATSGSSVPGSAGSTGTSAASGCTLTVAAAPEIVDAVGAVAAQAQDCDITVSAVDPANFAASWTAAGAVHPDVWIPDSSVWVGWAAGAGVPVPAGPPSIATSPVVYALAAPTAQTLSAAGPVTVTSLLGTRLSATPIRMGLPAPRESADAVGGILALQAAVTGQPDARAALTWGLRSSPANLPTSGSDLLTRIGSDPGTAVPVTEQALWAHNQQAGAVPAVAVYPATGTELDYPFVALGGTATGAADALLRSLLAADGKAALQSAGFRDPSGAARGALTGAAAGINPHAPSGTALSDSAAVEDAVHDVEVSNEPSRLLAILDTSGSMQAQVPGSGGQTRIDLAKAAAKRGLGLYPPDSELGLWVFSTNLTPTTDYRELVPVGALAAGPDGVTGQQKLAQALDGAQAIPDGGTGLYDTTLAAVRALRASWDPNRVNTVLILSDGMNDDANAISLPDLLTALKNEADPQKPVTVISIGFGPDSDVDALTQISTATGGSTYVSLDPKDIGEIFLDAVGQRMCRPNCGAG